MKDRSSILYVLKKMYVLCIVAGVDYILKDAVSEISPLHMCWVNYKLEQKM